MEALLHSLRALIADHPIGGAGVTLGLLAVMGLGVLEATRITLQLLTLMISEYRRSLNDVRRAVIHLVNETTVTLDTSDTESVGEFIAAVKNTGRARPIERDGSAIDTNE